MSDSNAKHLGMLIRQRRKELKLTQADIQERGGPSTATLRLIEGGRHTDFRPATVAPLETILGWAAGSIDAVLDGGTPTPSEPVRASPPQRTASMAKDEQHRKYEDYRIAELPLIYPLLSRDGQLEVAAHGRQIFNIEYQNHTIGEINALLAETHDADTATSEGTPSETRESEKRSADDAKSADRLDTAMGGMFSDTGSHEGFQQQRQGG